MFTTGQIVYSKCGRDKGLAFIVYSFEGDYAMLVDGKVRPLRAPKKKKLRHIQITNFIDADIKNKIDNNLYLTDADFRSALLKHSQR